MSNLADRLTAARGRRARPANDNHLLPAATVRWFAWLSAECAAWPRRWRSRAELARFADRDLRDLGINRAQADRECAKPFWRA